jgi:hypothetical protein
MADPQTTNRGFYAPTRGSDSGVWDLPINANSSAYDSMFSNVSTLTLGSANVTLSVPPNSGASWAGPYQSQSALINMTGTITTNLTITIPCAGFFLFWNQCLSSSGIYAGSINTAFNITLASAAPGSVIGARPGRPFWVFCDGVNVNYIDEHPTGMTQEWFLQNQALPSWVTGCTTFPWIIADHSTYNNSQFPVLAGVLGNMFGGTPGVSFRVPNIEVNADPDGIIVIKT